MHDIEYGMFERGGRGCRGQVLEHYQLTELSNLSRGEYSCRLCNTQEDQGHTVE